MLLSNIVNQPLNSDFKSHQLMNELTEIFLNSLISSLDTI